MNRHDIISLIAFGAIPIVLIGVLIAVAFEAMRPFDGEQARCRVFQIMCGLLALAWTAMGRER